MIDSPADQNVQTRRVFHQFSQLNDELVINILSYIADIPYQTSSFGKSNGFICCKNVPIGTIFKLTDSFVASTV